MDPITSIVTLGTSIIDKIFPNKDEAEKAKLKLIELQQNGELEKIKISMSAIVAEAQSQDKWTSRARPSFMYVMYIMILFSLPMAILGVFSMESVLKIETGLKGWLSAIPLPLWEFFGAGYLGYSASRSYDKKQILNSKSH
jgi:hypothetical protein